MRTVILALIFVTATGAGAVIARAEGPVTAALVLALATLGLACSTGPRRALGLTGPRRALGLGHASPLTQGWVEERSSEAARVRVLAAALVVVGLARGASGHAQMPAQVPERGQSAVPSAGPAGGPLREFEVVGASEPGSRCVIELRNPGDRAGPTRTVSAPPEICPVAEGQRVAVSARALASSWEASVTGASLDHLGPGPVVWLRPSAAPRGLDRVRAGYWGWVAATRQRAWAASRGDRRASLVVAVGLGLRSALAPDEREQLRAAGLGHLIAVSGLHVAVAALGLQVLARRCVALVGGDVRWACVIAWLPLWGYVGLTGAAPSAVRAALMLTGLDLATLSGRPSHGPTLLAVTAAVMLLVEPSWWFAPGFWLSLAAMAAIVSARPGPAPDDNSGAMRHDGSHHGLLGVLAISWRITWMSAPLMLLWFDAAPLHGLLANAVALPLFALLMPASLVVCLGPEPLAGLAGIVAELIAAPILDLAALLGRWPAAGPLPLVVLAGVAAAIHVGLARRRGRRRHDPNRASVPAAWLPPKLACALTLAIGLALLAQAQLDRRRAGPVEFDWIAVGHERAPALLLGDPSTPGSACLLGPRGSARLWLGVFEQVGVHRLAELDPFARADPSAPILDDPASAALLDRFAAAGIDVSSASSPGRHGCERPDRARVRTAVRACRDRQGGEGWALVRARGGRIDCRIVDRWVAAVELERVGVFAATVRVGITVGWLRLSPD
jgi:ComEC/Rec2-related protein